MSVDDEQILDSVSPWSPLSYSQQRLWLFQQLQPMSLAYNLGGLLWFEGKDITVEKLQHSLNEMVSAFPSLRSQFAEVEGKAVQRVMPFSPVEYDYIDMQGDSNTVEFINQDARQRWQQTFNLVESNLARCCIYQVTEHRFAVLLATHHIVTDAWSFQITIKMLVNSVAGKTYQMKVVQSYLDYAAEQASAEKSAFYEQQKSSWLQNHFIGEESLSLSNLNDQPQDTYGARHELVHLSNDINDSIKQLGSELGATKFEVLASAMMLTLRQYSSNVHPSICVPALNRNAQNRRTVGFYVNSAVMGYRIDAEMTLSQLVNNTHASMKASLAYESTPLEALAGDLPLPTTALNFRNHGDKLSINTNGVSAEFEEFPVLETPFELVLDVINKGDAPLRFVYAKEKFTRPFITKFIESFKINLATIVQSPNAAVASVNALSSKDMRLIDQHGSGDYSWQYRPFTDLVTEQAVKCPNSIALKHQNESMSYLELETRSNQLAHSILSQGTAAKSPIGVMMERGVDMIVSMIAVLKAGSPFLPLDPDYPTERLSFMLEDSGAELLLTHSKSDDRYRDVLIGSDGVTQFCVENAELASLPSDNSFNRPLAEELAYIIYTSGSTGKPKGVTISNEGLSMHVQTIGQRYGMSEQDVELHFASISFDGAVERWTVPLAFGSKLVIRDQELWTAEQTCNVLQQEGVTIACFPPSYVGPLLDWIEAARPSLALRSITLGGEAFTRETFDRIQDVLAPPRIINGYGPTETVITPMVWEAYADDTMNSAYAPIGTAVGDRKLYVLDSELSQVPFGCSGELYIGSEVGLAEGYLKQPNLTAERFLPDPFSNNGERMYRTGDLVQWRDDGVMEYLGRVDQQVKIRGFRVELGEIESQLQALSGAEFCAVVDHESPTGKKLVGYVQLSKVQQSKAPSNTSQLQSENDNEEAQWLELLGQTLPDYMVPACIIVQDKLPLTPAGKVDRKELFAPDWTEVRSDQGALENNRQVMLAEIWCELLKVKSVGANSQFFALGGDSIMALQLVGKLRQLGFMLSPKQVFDFPKLRDMAGSLEEAKLVVAEQGKRQGSVALLPIQQRYIEHFELNRCNQYIQFKWDYPVDVERLTRAVHHLVEHHDALRLRFSHAVSSSSPIEITANYQDDVEFAIHSFDGEININQVQTSIDLINGVIGAVGIRSMDALDEATEHSEVLIAIHHLVVDALSWPVIIEDLVKLYVSEPTSEFSYEPREVSGPHLLTQKTHHQGNWANALNTLSISDEQQAYWVEQTKEPLYSTLRGKPISTQWYTPLSKIEALVKAGFGFARLTQEQIVYLISALTVSTLNQGKALTIHRESHGRFTEATGLDLSRTVGWYTSLYPQAIPVLESLEEWVKSLKDSFETDHLGGVTFHAGVTQSLWSHVGDMDVLFNYLGNAAQQMNDAVEVTNTGLWRDESNTADAAIVINASVAKEVLLWDIELDSACFSESEVEVLHAALSDSLEQLHEVFNDADPVLTRADAPLIELNQIQLNELCKGAISPLSLPVTILPLSTLQQGLYFHAKLSDSDSTYVNQITLPLNNVNVPRMVNAWQGVMQRHQMLRSTLFSFDGNAYLAEWAELSLDYQFLDVRQRRQFDLEEYKQQRVERGFQLEQVVERSKVAPLWSVDFIQTHDHQVQCVFTIHHILMDGWSTGVLLSDLFALYHGRSIAPVKAEFSDYLAWTQRQDKNQSNEYWQRYLQDMESPTRLAESFGNSDTSESNFQRYNDDFSQETISQWLPKLNQIGVTLNTLTQAAWLLTLNRFTGQEIPVFGNTVAGRPTELADSDSMVGLFINTLPIAHHIDLSKPVSEWLLEIQTSSSEQREFSYSSLSDIQAQTGWSGENLFDTLVVFENYPLDEALLNDKNSNSSAFSIGEPESYEFTHYPLTLAILPSDSLRIVFAYDESKFTAQQIEALRATNRHYLNQLVDHLTEDLGNLSALADDQLSELNAFERQPEPWTFSPFTDLVAQQMLLRPDSEALVSNVEVEDGQHRESLTYREVVEQSDAIAHRLIMEGVQRDDIVGVLFERDCNMLVAMMGVMKAGAAFLPLDPAYPQERLDFMVQDSGASVLIHDALSESLVNQIGNQAKTISYAAFDLTKNLNDKPVILPDQLAYMIYTSGSTGKPKGVCVSQLGLSMHVQTIGQRYGMTSDDVELHFASISFDGAIERWTVPLAFGSRLVIRDQSLWSAQQTCDVLAREQVTIACFPPSYVLPLLEWIEGSTPTLSVRSWTLGGEAFTRDTYFKLQQVLKPKRIINGYGPTETVVTPMIWEAYSDTELESAYAPIGKAVGNRTLYVLDSALHRVPAGVAGELYIGEEVGLARGYFERPDLTSERFIPDPFSNNGERMYRTGDLVKWRLDGVIEYLGRSDEQVKIRGFRVELGEIESRLQKSAGSEQCAVVAYDSPTGKQLVAYIQSDNTLSIEDILQDLSKDLPDYMVPSQVVQMDKIPLTPASKVDKKRLPVPNWQAVAIQDYIPPIGEMEQVLAQQWRVLFDKELIGRDDDFFALGGQSLLATQLVGRLKQQDDIRLSLQAVFDTSVLKELATHCIKDEAELVTLAQTPRLPYMPTSAVQKRLWFVQQLLPTSAAYHMPLGLKFTGNVNVAALERAINVLVERHEILRTNFSQVEGELMQSIHADREICLGMHESLASDEQRLLAYKELIAKPFDFSEGPLIRFDWIVGTTERPAGVKQADLLIVAHHIVSDGISMQLLLKELAHCYQSMISEYAENGRVSASEPAAIHDLQYVDYANWQKHWLESKEASDQKAWWLDALKYDIDPLVLHSDTPREQTKTQGNRLHFELSTEQISSITKLATSHKTTPFNVMLTLWHLLMHKYSGQEQVRVGVPVAGRTQPETQSMQGCFINSLVIPAHFNGEQSFSDLLHQVKSFTEQALGRQDFPFEMLVESLGITGNLQYHPVFQTSFNFQRFDEAELFDWQGLGVEPFDPGVVNAQLEIGMDIQQMSESKWLGFVSYVSPIFTQDFAQALLGHWLLLLDRVATNSDGLVSQLHLIDETAEQQNRAFNDTSLDWGGFVTPSQAIQQQAKETPDAIALSMQGQTLTYKEFDKRVNQLANWLRDKGVNSETRVGLGLERSFDLVIGLHAIARAGGAYVPLDPGYPTDRLQYILESANIACLLTDSNSMHLWPESNGCEYVDLNKLDVSKQSSQPPKVNWQPEQALYVIFTSGSTGLPKGVVNTQAALQNRLNWMQQEYVLNQSDCVLQKTPFSFDVSVWEFFWPLMAGARLAIAPPETHRQPNVLSEVIQQEQVTTIHFVPSMLNAFSIETNISDCTSLKRIICSGEALPADLVEQVLSHTPVELHNLYGPTEAAIDVTYWPCELPVSKRIPIGYAICNTQLYVLDDNWNPVPIGVPGELYLTGIGLAREYLARPDLTADRFIPNPFGEAGSRMYRTGDQVVQLADGRLEYLGRLDNQVKIRGLRIELEEIENVMNQLEWVEESAVIAFKHQTGEQLVGYVVDSNWSEDKQALVKQHLSEHLPDYMVPPILIGLDEMPLSPNGKRDRKALPAPEWQSIEYRAPETELEIWFATHWAEVLAIPQVGLDDNFFALGGHSLLATRVVAKAHQELGLDVALKDFFEAKSLQALTDSLQSHYQTQNQHEQDEFDAMAALMDELELL
ncbi:non-ribosomal peptide synthetase [Vibrio sp. L3-7]|uniref:non-ribosomal peptide synthetase n=1 Tax=Vibrio sp. L3-7 TaxID=2912253 RepID=UPI00119398BB|nr:non-ribosomal peptide synthetase [Vibrio sp. L3-7]MCF7505109.1 amino acid adenylation domain-containing protein [Vibrio sp. L3-7]TVU79300.1 amino acid adenylation domain-containing protein [Vibrio tasmaniensis]